MPQRSINVVLVTNPPIMYCTAIAIAIDIAIRGHQGYFRHSPLLTYDFLSRCKFSARTSTAHLVLYTVLL